MSVYIRGMEMPKDWYSCPFSNGAAGCKLQDNIVCAKVYKEHTCPLIPVPDHGRLIDADKLPWYLVDARDILDAPTVIPADKEGE